MTKFISIYALESFWDNLRSFESNQAGMKITQNDLKLQYE